MSRLFDERTPKIPERFKSVNPQDLMYFSTEFAIYLERDVLHLNSFKGVAILDVGSGTGILSKILSDRGGVVTAVDQDAECMHYAVQMNYVDPSRAFSIPGKELSEELNQSFDFIIMSQALITPFSDWDPTLKRISELLKPEGIFYLGYTDQMYHADKFCSLKPIIEKYFSSCTQTHKPKFYGRNEFGFTCKEPIPSPALLMDSQRKKQP
ncbi:MAG: methyltransferase domain-containing protein [Coxiellaceae bacterium]|nr:methyltransferase domain-containing protein [Coxiellaceae bacterium]